MQDSTNCEHRSIEFVCTSCRSFICKECIGKHSNISCYIDNPNNYFSRLLCVKQENLEDYLSTLETIKKQVEEKFISTNDDIQLINGIKEELKNLEEQIKKDEKIEDPSSLLSKFMELDNNIPSFYSSEENVKKIPKEDKELSEEIKKMEELSEEFENMKKMHAIEEEEHKKIMTEIYNQQVELNRKNNELEKENERLSDTNMRLKEIEAEYDEIAKNIESDKERLINEFTSKQNELQNLEEQIAKMSEEKTKIDEECKKKLSELNTVTTKVKKHEKAFEGLGVATGKLDEIEFEITKQSDELKKLKKKCSEKKEENEKLNFEEAKAKKSLNGIEDKRKKLIEESNQLNATLKGLKDSIEECKKNKANIEKECNLLTKKLSQLSGNYHIKVKEAFVNKVKVAIGKLQHIISENNKEINEKLDIKIKAYDSLKPKLDKLKEKIERKAVAREESKLDDYVLVEHTESEVDNEEVPNIPCRCKSKI